MYMLLCSQTEELRADINTPLTAPKTQMTKRLEMNRAMAEETEIKLEQLPALLVGLGRLCQQNSKPNEDIRSRVQL